MPLFTYITDLPPQVQMVLNVTMQQAWLDTFNTVLNITGNEREAYQTAWQKVISQAFPGEIPTPNDLPQMLPPASAVPQPTASAMAAAGLLAANEADSHMGYMIDASTIKLDDSTDTCWIQALPIGTYQHPVHGTIDITPEKVLQFANNVNANARGTELDIDYDHKEKTTEAAGWVKQAAARADGLWILVEWTKNAAQKIRERAFKYFSPEFADSWVHPKTSIKYKNILFGGALTNRPFLKDILPINMSEVIRAETGGSSMDLKKLLGLPDTASDADVAAAVAALKTKAETPPPPHPDDQGGDNGGGNEGENSDGQQQQQKGQLVNANELNQQQVRALAETDPIVRALNDRVALLEGALHASNVTTKLNALESDGVALAPAMLDKVKSLVVEAPKELGDKILDMLSDVVKNGVVQLGETGSIRPATRQGGGGDSATKRFTELAEGIKKANEGMDEATAWERAAAQDPALFVEYRDEIYVREGAK